MRSFQKLAGCFAAVLAACASTPPPKPTPEPQPAPAATPAPAPAPPPQETPPAETRPTVAAVSIYFDFDSSAISDAARSTLQSFYDAAQERSDLRVRIEGNCDERGTAEYNLALGQRRADAAKKYLMNLGMDGSRIRTVSNGKEKPRAQGHDESAWRENRRDDVQPEGSTLGQRLPAR
jgi:peptidoglycan-associated lipoprotein